jgi:hypothetical protein
MSLPLMPKDETLFDWPDAPNPKKSSKSRPQKAALVAEELIEQVFQHWVLTCRSGRGPKPAMSDQRIVVIGAAIHDYGVKTCLDAITGCSFSDWHMGQNPQGKKYNDVELIFRNAQNIERFAGMAMDRQSGGGFLDED